MHNQISQSPYQLLSHHYAGKGISPFKVQASIRLDNASLGIDFQVESLDESYKWVIGKDWNDEYYKNWQLWDTDVVELYLQLRQVANEVKAHYYEFQVNPANKSFALKTIEPRNIIWTPTDLNFKTQVRLEGSKWLSQMQINLKELGVVHNQDYKIFGNIHACLGSAKSRSYFSAFNIQTPLPDFHRPQQFQEFKYLEQS